MERFRAEQPEPAAADRASAAPDMSEILRYLYCHTGEKLTLKGLSRIFYVSESSLSSYISGMTGLSFFDLLNEMRIGKTANYLLYTDLTLEEIAAALGPSVDAFAYSSRFFRARGNAHQRLPQDLPARGEHLPHRDRPARLRAGGVYLPQLQRAALRTRGRRKNSAAPPPK